MITRRAAWLALLLLAAATACTDQRREITAMPADDIIDIWLASVERVRPDQWIEVEDMNVLGDRVRGDTSMWLEYFMNPAADPDGVIDVKRTAHAATDDTSDLLRYEYEAADHKLVVTEQCNFALIEVLDPGFDPASPDETAKIVAVNAIADKVLNMSDDEHKWEFKFNAPLVEGAHFSTDMTADPRGMTDWTKRADGGIRNGKLWFLCIKKHRQRVGFDDSQDWFDARFRAHAAQP